jgi:hypothetical protein
MGHRVASHVRANVVAYVALFFALGGTSFAAAKTLVPRNSVGSPQVIDNSLRLRDFNRIQRARLRGPQGRQGRQGIQGAQGPKGDKGDPGATNVVLVSKVVHVVASGGNSVDCPAGARATGGGVAILAPGASDILQQSGPIAVGGALTRWGGGVYVATPGGRNVEFDVICASP